MGVGCGGRRKGIDWDRLDFMSLYWPYIAIPTILTRSYISGEAQDPGPLGNVYNQPKCKHCEKDKVCSKVPGSK